MGHAGNIDIQKIEGGLVKSSRGIYHPQFGHFPIGSQLIECVNIPWLRPFPSNPFQTDVAEPISAYLDDLLFNMPILRAAAVDFQCPPYFYGY